jgi:hypothetical protein
MARNLTMLANSGAVVVYPVDLLFNTTNCRQAHERIKLVGMFGDRRENSLVGGRRSPQVENIGRIWKRHSEEPKVSKNHKKVKIDQSEKYFAGIHGHQKKKGQWLPIPTSTPLFSKVLTYHTKRQRSGKKGSKSPPPT